jgi:hypothetical protein
MKGNISINEFDITVPNFQGWLPRRGKICPGLWNALSRDAAFDAFDERIQEMCWAYLFACGGLTLAVRCPEGLVFQLAFDMPRGPTIFRLLASIAPDERTVSFSQFGT